MSRRNDSQTMSLFGADETDEKTQEVKGEKLVVVSPKAKTFFTYDEYERFFCGNSAAAGYWWKVQMDNMEETKRIWQ